jgi:protein arginine N-methyltransferase 1
LRPRQTVFYTPTAMTVNEGDKITGRLTCAPNARNNRDLDITIAYKAPSDEEKVVSYKMFVSSSFFVVFRFLCV